ncbi:HlyC/CorC family transporter [Clostridium polynesiense]|uniref:HlyC/CorC family transporter n=1 Tax=Clostridium polynesiense TaxID=1325933 RepID=UPI00058F87AB|nr:hemolysin family protein [Clostridium polynesiense]
MEPSSTWEIVSLIVLLCFSAFFSMSETALMSLSKIRIRHMVEENVKNAALVEKLVGNPHKLLGSILVGNNVVNIAASALATSISYKTFGDKGVAIATGLMTILVLIFGEITPKSLAAQNSEAVSLKVSKPIAFFVYILKPLVVIFTYISSLFIRLLGGNPDATQPFITQEELKTMVDVSEEEGVLEIEEKQMIYNVFEFGDLQVKDVMVQRVDIIAVDTEASYEEILQVIKTEQFSRIPIYNETIDDIVGILNVKDLLVMGTPESDFDVTNIMREPYYTFEFKKITDLFAEMKKSRNHLSVVLDEYGGTVGIVTIEDLVEEIVGDIEDEYDDEVDKEIEVIKEDEYVVSGSTRIPDLNDMIGINIESEEFDSVGGFVIGQLGRFPEQAEEIQYQHIKFVVEDIDKNRIKKVRIFT